MTAGFSTEDYIHVDGRAYQMGSAIHAEDIPADAWHAASYHSVGISNRMSTPLIACFLNFQFCADVPAGGTFS